MARLNGCLTHGVHKLLVTQWNYQWHWKSHWKFLWHWKDTETTLKNIYKGNHSDNPGLSHWNIFLCCSRTLKSHWKFLNYTDKFSGLLISFVPRFFSVTLDFQHDFQCHSFIKCHIVWNYQLHKHYVFGVDSSLLLALFVIRILQHKMAQIVYQKFVKRSALKQQTQSKICASSYKDVPYILNLWH